MNEIKIVKIEVPCGEAYQVYLNGVNVSGIPALAWDEAVEIAVWAMRNPEEAIELYA